MEKRNENSQVSEATFMEYKMLKLFECFMKIYKIKIKRGIVGEEERKVEEEMKKGKTILPQGLY